MRVENKLIFPSFLSYCRIVEEKKRYDKLNDAAYSALKYRNCAANLLFKKKTFTVTFMSKSNDILKEETVEYGDGATAPDAPHVDGYEFIGWDKAFDNVTEDITVTALYRELPIAPAPAAQKPTPEPAAEPPATDVPTDDLLQTGISVATVAMAGSFAGIAAIAARRRKSTKR